MTTTTHLDELPSDVSALKAIIAEHVARIALLEQENRLLRKELFAPKSERRPQDGAGIDPLQLHLLFPELAEAFERVAMDADAAGNVTVQSAGRSSRPKRRATFPAHLPVIRTTYELPPEQRRCPCGQELAPMGDVITRELERVEISVVHEIVRKRYACKACEGTVQVAPGPARVLDKGILGAGFLAHLLVERFAHHMPYNRLQGKYASEGLDLARSVLCTSALRCADLLAPIAQQVRRDALDSGIVQTDDTPVTIKEGSDQCSRQGHVWIYRGLGGQVFFDMTESRSRDGPARVLQGFRGLLQADAYAAYDELYKGGTIIEVGCWAHARRYFVDAEVSEPELARLAIAKIAELYAIERQAKEAGLTSDQVRELRRLESKPRLERLRLWLGLVRTRVLDRGRMAKAIQYALSNWTCLVRYCEDGRLSIDNNAAERGLRAVAVGRKNWIFFGNERGGQAAAVLYSLIATCRESGVDPRSYLRDVLLRIGTTSDVRELTPYGWKERWMKLVDGQRANVVRRVLSEPRA